MLGEAEVDVLWLEISVDDLADAVQVVQAHQALLRHYTDKRQRDALVVVALNDFKQVDAKNLEDHHKVLTVRTMVQEAVEKLDAMAVVTCDIFKLFGLLGVILFERVEPFWFHPVAGDLIKDFDLVKGGNEVVARRSLNFQRNIRVILDVLGEPDGRKVAPAQLLDDQISVDQNLSAVKITNTIISKPNFCIFPLTYPTCIGW